MVMQSSPASNIIEFDFKENSGSFPKCQGIYAIRGKHNGFHLVGQTSRPMCQRWIEHRQKLRQNKHDNPYLQNSFNKNGEQNFSFLLLEECISELINLRECFWISFLNSMRNCDGWNLREGGAYGLYGTELRKRVSEGIRKSSKARASREARSKTYSLRSPNGQIVTFTNRSRFCRENDLNSACLWRVINKVKGTTKHKGWTLP